MTDWKAAHEAGLRYAEFLATHGTEAHRERWSRVHERVALTAAQRTLLASFTRQMNVLCLAGTWCGDCVNQCPIFDHIATACPQVHLRFLDRDQHPDVAETLSVNAGRRVPVVVFLSEDHHECGRYGERTLATYRRLAADQLGPACPTGITAPPDDLLAAVTADWLREFERIQLLLRLSPRLRQKHGD